VRRRKIVKSPFSDLYHRVPHYTMPDGRVIEKDEIIKIKGEHGGKFKFVEHVTRTDSGIEWIDCFELRGGILCGWRSFYPDRIKPLPKTRRRRRKKVV
jgi:hypothetical protein